MRVFLSAVLFLFVVAGISTSISAQTTEFTYQGNLQSSSLPATGNFDFEFLLFDTLNGGGQQGPTLTRSTVAVTGGTFAVILDFGSVFPGAARFLEIRVRSSGGVGFTTLTPRQLVTNAPYAVKSLSSDTAATATNSATAGNALNLGGVAASQFVQTVDPRLSDARSPLPGSSSYIQNGTSAQAASNFNVSGTGTANIINAVTQYNIGGGRVLSTPGANNIFAGTPAGTANTSGAENSFFGASVGNNNTTGSQNTFVGHLAGNNNTTGDANTFVGRLAGSSTSIGTINTFVGHGAGLFNSSGQQNSFFGFSTGIDNTTGSFNTVIGSQAGLGATNLTNATAIGYNALVSQSNSLVLGNNSANVGIGVSAPAAKLHVNNGSIRVTNGGIFIANPNTLVITAPNGSCYGITVNNSGVLGTFPVAPCP